MTLEELEKTLPNGLHDAELLGLHIDYSAREAIVRVNVDVSDSNSSADGEPDYRAAQLRFFDLQFAVVDPPALIDFRSGVSPISVGTGEPATAPLSVPQVTPERFLCWIFVVESNSFVRIAARSVELHWNSDYPKSSD